MRIKGGTSMISRRLARFEEATAGFLAEESLERLQSTKILAADVYRLLT
jgi:hypothetical protein